jgi:geranylgeranyl diphosphate synthase type I
MRYHLGWEDRTGRPVDDRGGKLLRPALCLLSCEAAGGDWNAALPAAAALELLHNFTLIHDDIEDESAHRHGRETLWRLTGVAQAINAGDGMFALAHLTLLRLSERGHPPDRVLRAARLLDEATVQLCAGQHLDLSNAGRPDVSLEDYLSMIEGKTASLLAASCAIGALLGGADGDTVERLHEFGRRLGLAFQIRDDVLGIWGDASVTGKPESDDLRAGKKSYPVVLALERLSGEDRATLVSLLAKGDLSDDDVARARELLDSAGAREESERVAREHSDLAIAALEGLPLDAGGLGELRALARFAGARSA